MKAPKVSVMMVVHNAEKFLRQAIESVLSQSFGDFELLIHDDGSNDRSVEIIHSFRDSRIRAISNPVNQGEAPIRNQALRIARGEYVAVLDADDIAHKDRLRIQSDFLDRNRDISLLGSSYEIINESGRVIGNQNVATSAPAIRWKLLFGNQFGHSTVMYRRADVLAIGGYDETLCFAPDFDLWVRLAMRSGLANLKNPVSQYRVHSRNVTHTTRSAVKDSSLIEIVAKSIHLHTGQAIDFGVAMALSNDIHKPAPNNAALESAYRTICWCLACFIGSVALNRHESRTLVTLAAQDLCRLAHRNPGSGRLALIESLGSVARYDPYILIKKHYVGTVANHILPFGIMEAVKRITRGAPQSTTNEIDS